MMLYKIRLLTKIAYIYFIAFFLTLGFVEKSQAQTKFPGIIVVESPDAENQFVASPSITILPDGSYLVSHDWYGAGRKEVVTSIYRSMDKGLTWKSLTDIKGLMWASIFVHQGSIYLMGVNRSFGDVVIVKSTDNGVVWTKPVDDKSGILFKGRLHTAPTPVVVHNGRIWKAYEENKGLKKRDFYAFMLSAPLNADLLMSDSWTRSTAVRFDSTWLNARDPKWLEGNAVVAPNGKIVDIIRLQGWQSPNDTYEIRGAAEGMTRYEVAGKIDVSDDGKTSTFNPKRGLIHFPGAEIKFSIRYDPVSKRYWSLVNKITNNFPGSNLKTLPMHQRNVIMLTSSKDLINWKEHTKLLVWNEGKKILQTDQYGFQYLDWQFDGDDIIAVSRTAWKAKNFHDANLITFHRFEKFRKLTKANDQPDMALQRDTK